MAVKKRPLQVATVIFSLETFTGRFLLSQITLRPAPEFYILPQFL
ncbi:hypothetical protein LTSEMIN_2956 [Salmonella enterica subsp. enterica serovar Minnesota str. A4-603]|nr:hypothetical protein LTSEMIN_2956 [Salmonella enterica subsp. enterica serovar Minnesota str. A4-603]